MTILLEVNGVPYDNFKSAVVEIRLDVLSNTFSFTAVRNKVDPLPFRVGDACRVLVNDVVVLTGSIELMTIQYTSTTHQIELAGRDRTSDLLDSTLNAFDDIEEGPTLKSLIEKAIAQIQSTLKVIQSTPTERFNPAEDIASPEAGTNAFKWVERLARQKQVLLTSDGDGNVVITQGSGEVLPNVKLQNAIGAEDNNIKEASASYDNTGRYNLYVLSSQLNPVALVNAGETDLGSVVDQSGRSTDDDINLGRQLILVAESSFSSDNDLKRAQWEHNIRKARGLMYTATVQGYDTGTGEIWQINKLISVVDVFAGVFGQLLINTVKFNLDELSGETTELTLLNKNAYTLALAEPVSDQLGAGFV